MRRVVITGLGLISPLASGVEETWSRILNGDSGASLITRFNADRVATKYACEVPYGDGLNGTFNADDWMEPKERRKVDDFILYGIAASEMAVRDAAWKPADEASLLRTGVMIGSGIGGLNSIAETAVMINERGPKRISPFFIPGALINLISGQVSIRFGFKGPNHSVVTACSTGAHAIGDAARLIAANDADVMIAGGAEAAISEIGIGGFNACKALSTKRADDPTKASRPYDIDRDGFVMGEGAGALILESLEHAQSRGANIYAEVAGGGLSADAHHITAPHPEGLGATSVMENCIADAGVGITDVDAINMHGTSTPLGDVAETKALKDVFGKHLYDMNINSTKSMTGHLLGAAGAVEAISSVLSIKHGIVPPTINHQTADDQLDPKINFTLGKAQKRTVDVALSNTFGFGGHNACIVFKKIS